MPWQAYVLDVANEVDPVTGWWAYDEVVVTIPRQAGKTTIKIPVYLHRMQLVPDGELWMTAQNGEKAVDRWTKATTAMLRNPELEPLLKRWIGRSAWKMLYKPSGAILRPFAPNDEKMHGESPDLVDVDEWWAFDAVAAEALIAAYQPGLLTRNAQVWKTSTMGTEQSAGLNADVKKGRAAVEMDRRSGTAYFEWSLEDEPGGIPIVELSDDQLRQACIDLHPAIGFHPTAPAERMRHQIWTDLKTAGEDGQGKLSRREYIRGYGNRLQSSIGGWNVISQPAWIAAMASRAIPPGVPVGLGFEAAPDGSEGAIAMAWRGPDGIAVGEIIKVAAGVHWLADSVRALCKRWDVHQVAVQNSGPARHVADALIGSGLRIRGEDDVAEFLRLSQTDFSAACAKYKAGIEARPVATVRHIGQAVLNTAVEHVTKRNTGPTGTWAWRVDPDVPIAALVAHTAAVWACDHPREDDGYGPFRMY